MATKKLIHVNPELFKIGGNKTKKTREKKELILNPLVSPNNLKTKLLKRIKEHKINEIKHTNTNSTSNASKNNSSKNNPSSDNYTDEFYGAMDYLSDLTKKQKTNKFTNEAKQRLLNSKTLKNHYSTNNNLSENSIVGQNILLNLPAELQEPIKSSNFIPQNNDVFNVNYKADDVPYGCLKGGKKQTYREWKGTIKPEKIDTPDIIRPPTPPKKNLGVFLEGAQPINTNSEQDYKNKLSREERLEQIKNKLRKMQDTETLQKQKSLDDFKHLEKKFSSPLLEELPDLEDNGENESNDIEELLKKRKEKEEGEKTKNYLKKTIKRKFTLGKSDKLRRVSVLIKDRQTRKNIINTQKELKKTNITDVKKYLRQHGMIKVGSTCPTDILRKTFESAVLTGEIVNTNSEILLHNFMAGDKE